MSYRTAKAIISQGTEFAPIYQAEKIGRNLIIHREITSVDFNNGDEPSTYDAGKTWTVTLFPFGASLVTGLKSRAEARLVARELVPAVEAFRTAVEVTKENVRAGRITRTPVTTLDVI